MSGLSKARQPGSSIGSHAAAPDQENPHPITSIFLQSLNEVIELQAKRLAADRNQVPLSIYLMHLLVSIINMFGLEYEKTLIRADHGAASLRRLQPGIIEPERDLTVDS